MYAAFGWVDALVLGLAAGPDGMDSFHFFQRAFAHPGAAVAGGRRSGLAFTAITQLGTELAVLIYFRRDVTRTLLARRRSLPRLGRRGV